MSPHQLCSPFPALLERLVTEIARHTRAFQEAMSTQVSVIDDKYADLPARVTNLEATVFAPTPHGGRGRLR
jgi:hypothetical protein